MSTGKITLCAQEVFQFFSLNRREIEHIQQFGYCMHICCCIYCPSFFQQIKNYYCNFVTLVFTYQQ